MIDAMSFIWMALAGSLGALVGMFFSRRLKRRRSRDAPPKEHR